MIKHKKISFLMSGFLLAGVVIIGAQSALAYLTDYKSVVNTIKLGNNTTSIEEEFPAVTPISPGSNQIIEKLVKSGFAERKGKALIPTKDGCNLVCVLPEQIRSPKMTAEWENTLMEIERGNADADAFLSGIVRMTGDLVKAYPFLSDAEAQRFGTGKEEIGKCPRCGSPVYVGKGNFYCSNKECSFCLWEDNKFFSSKKKKLTKKIAKELLDKGWCRVTGLYTPKKPQLYDAVIRLDDSGGKYVSFKMEFDR